MHGEGTERSPRPPQRHVLLARRHLRASFVRPSHTPGTTDHVRVRACVRAGTYLFSDGARYVGQFANNNFDGALPLPPQQCGPPPHSSTGALSCSGVAGTLVVSCRVAVVWRACVPRGM
jgi:hypothetical protein